jgi:DNA-binding MarR family transcriptional regulator
MDDSGLSLILGLYRTANAVVRNLDQRLTRDGDVTFVQAVTLMAVKSFDHPQPHLVAEYLGQQSQTVTGVLDRLESAGYVQRVRDLYDRRAVRLELTKSGNDVANRVSSELGDHVLELLRRLDDRTQERLSTGLRALEASLKERSMSPSR